MPINKSGCFYLLVAVLFFSMTGCETVPVQPEPLKVEANTVIILHVESLHNELIDSAIPAYQQLVTTIADHGFNVVSLREDQYQQLREEALLVSGAVYDPGIGRFIPLDRDIYIKAIIELSVKHFSSDIVLIPEVVLRTADVTGDKVSWDGVKREISFVSKPATAYELPRKVKGLSLRLAGYTKNGAEVFLTFSGISLPYDMRYFDGKLSLELKKQFFTTKELKEGADLALKPFFNQVTYKNEK